MHPILIPTPWFDVMSGPIFAGLAALAAYFYFSLGRAQLGLNDDDFWGLMLALACGVGIGGVGFFALVYGHGVAANFEPLRRGTIAGGSSLGVFLGAVLAARLFCKRRRIAWAPVADRFGVAALLGLSVMRIGCLLNGCCHGRATSMPWGIIFTDPRCAVVPALRGAPLHPTQLYESIGCLILAAFIHYRVKPGRKLIAAAAGYAVLRFFVDFARAGDPGHLAALGLSSAQWVCLLILTAAIASARRSA